jgi:hypothetical protein
LVATIERAAAAVAERFPGSPPLRIGDLSAPLGGRHPRHRSHRTGRDADILYFAVDEHGVPVPGAGFFAYDRFGVARAPRDRCVPPVARSPGRETPRTTVGCGGLVFLDEARTWLFIRTLLAADDVPVQWIFCSAGIKQRLLAYAASFEPDPDVIVRASYVLHQPTTGRPHDDHFHVRIACTAAMRALGCMDDGPVWPWQRREHERPAEAETGYRGAGEVPPGAAGSAAPDVFDDHTLLAWLLEGLDAQSYGAEGGVVPRPDGHTPPAAASASRHGVTTRSRPRRRFRPRRVPLSRSRGARPGSARRSRRRPRGASPRPRAFRGRARA